MVYATSSTALSPSWSGAPHVHHRIARGGGAVLHGSTTLIVVPTGVHSHYWFATMWRGSLTSRPHVVCHRLHHPVHHWRFLRLMLAMTPADFQYHDTYFVGPISTMLLVTGAVFSILAGPTTGCRNGRGTCMTSGSANGTLVFAPPGQCAVFPHAFCRAGGHARRIPDYAPAICGLQHADQPGGLPSACPSCCLSGVIKCIRGGAKASDRVWGGRGGLEWTLSSPPYHSFQTPPDIRSEER